MAFVMCSCNFTPTPTPKKEKIEVDLPMENFINDFLNDKPNFFNNDITIEEGNQDFIRILSDTLNTSEGRMNLFDGIPLRLKTINKTKKLGYVAQFDSWIEPNGFDFHYVSDINFDVFCVIPDSVVTTLKEDKHYLLDGTYVGNLTYNESVQVLGKRTSVWSPKIGIEKDNSFHSEYYQRKVNLGCVLLLFDNIKEFNRREIKIVEK
jgi:hypothetical protein